MFDLAILMDCLNPPLHAILLAKTKPHNRGWVIWPKLRLSMISLWGLVMPPLSQARSEFDVSFAEMCVSSKP